jgi:superfamily II DNA or RNA helicase
LITFANSIRISSLPQILENFRNGEILVLCQHSIIIEGVDVPDVECIQIVRPTKSIGIWFQALGRGLRVADGKSHAIVIDHTSNFKDLPLPHIPMLWSLDQKVKRDHKCKDHLSLGFDPLEAMKPKEVVTPMVVVGAPLQEVEIDLDDPIKARIEYWLDAAKFNGYKIGWAVFQLFAEVDQKSLTQGNLMTIAKACGYKKGWVKHKLQEIQQGIDLSGNNYKSA